MTAMKDGENHPPILTPCKEKERAMSHWDRVTFPMLYSLWYIFIYNPVRACTRRSSISKFHTNVDFVCTCMDLYSPPTLCAIQMKVQYDMWTQWKCCWEGTKVHEKITEQQTRSARLVSSMQYHELAIRQTTILTSLTLDNVECKRHHSIKQGTHLQWLNACNLLMLTPRYICVSQRTREV